MADQDCVYTKSSAQKMVKSTINLQSKQGSNDGLSIYISALQLSTQFTDYLLSSADWATIGKSTQ